MQNPNLFVRSGREGSPCAHLVPPAPPGGGKGLQKPLAGCSTGASSTPFQPGPNRRVPKYHNLTHMYFNLRRTKQVRQIRHRPVPSNRLRLKCAYKKTFSLDLFMAGCFFSLLCFFVVVCLFLLIGSQQQPCKRTSLHCWVHEV